MTIMSSNATQEALTLGFTTNFGALSISETSQALNDASLFYECFLQLIKHFLKSRSWKDLALMFRKKKRSFTSCCVCVRASMNCTHKFSEPPYPALLTTDEEMQNNQAAVFTRLEQSRGTVRCQLRTAPKSFPFMKMLNDTPQCSFSMSRTPLI